MKVRRFTLFVLSFVCMFTLVCSHTQQASAACDLSPRFAFQTKGLSVQFKNKSTGIVQSVEWDFGDGQTSTESNPKHFYAATGMYAFSITVANNLGCTETFESKVYVFDTRQVQAIASTNQEDAYAEKSKDSATTVELLGSIKQFSVAPNPVVTNAAVYFQLSKAGKTSIRLYDLEGRFVAMISQGQRAIGKHTVNLERNGLPAGIYIVAIENQTEEVGQKVLFQ